MVVEDAQTGFVGAVVRIEYGRMELEDRHGRRKPFPIGPGYLIDGRPVILTAPRQRRADGAGTHRIRFGGGVRRTRQGRAGEPDLRRGPPRRRTRRAGVGRRPARRGRRRRIPRRRRRSRRRSSRSSGPAPAVGFGVLVDHLVAGSKEARIADAVRRGPGGVHTLVVGHPFIDIWQAVKPARLGVSAWPVIPQGRGLEARRVPGAGLAARPAGRHREGVAADPRAACGTGTISSRRSSAGSRN